MTRDDDDWYELSGQDLWLKTSGCYAFSFSEEAVLRVNASGVGTLYVDDNTCVVEGIYARLRL